MSTSYVRGDRAIHNLIHDELDEIKDAIDGVYAGAAAQSTFGTVAAGVAVEKAAYVAPTAMDVVGFRLVNGAAVALDAVNYSKYELRNKGAAGAGTTVLATFDGSTEAFAAFDAVIKTFAAVALAAGDVLAVNKVVTGTGQASTDLLVAVIVKPRVG